MECILDHLSTIVEVPVLQVSASQPFRIQATKCNSVSHAKQPGMWPILSPVKAKGRGVDKDAQDTRRP